MYPADHDDDGELVRSDIVRCSRQLADIRARARELLADEAEALRVDALLLIDSLLTDALRFDHPPRVLRLRRINRGHCLRVEMTVQVGDTSELCRDLLLPSGHSRLLLEDVTNGWDVVVLDGRKTVWAEMDLV